MSRVPPFPASRHSSSSQTPQASSTRPLHIPRPARVTRPESPNTIPIGPARPRRSELRGRTVENDTERASSVALEDQYRDSVSTTHSAMSGQLHPQQEVSRPPASRKATSIPPMESNLHLHRLLLLWMPSTLQERREDDE